MKFLLLPVLLASAAMAADLSMNLLGGAYNFNYNTGDQGGHSRSESGSGSSVSGQYSYVDPNGDLRSVSYTAGPDGFKPSGDISVDRKTAAEAARLAALAPKAPIPAAPIPAAPVYGIYGGHMTPNVFISGLPGGASQYMARW